MRIDNHGVLRLDEDVEALINAGKPHEAYELLCSKFPKETVERLKKGYIDDEDQKIVPTLEQSAICIGEGWFKWDIEHQMPLYEYDRVRIQDNTGRKASEFRHELDRQKKIHDLEQKETAVN